MLPRKKKWKNYWLFVDLLQPYSLFGPVLALFRRDDGGGGDNVGVIVLYILINYCIQCMYRQYKNGQKLSFSRTFAIHFFDALF